MAVFYKKIVVFCCNSSLKIVYQDSLVSLLSFPSLLLLQVFLYVVPLPMLLINCKQIESKLV